MNHKDIYTFEYKGIACEIAHWGVDLESSWRAEGVWNSYIIILKKQLSRSFRKLLCKETTVKIGRFKRKHWDYYKLNNYFNLHGDITYYEVLRDQSSGEVIGVKVGCDYAHLHDDGISYNESIVQQDLKDSVDQFITCFPNYKVWNPKDGKYIKPKENYEK